MSASLVGSEMCIRDRPVFCTSLRQGGALSTGAPHDPKPPVEGSRGGGCCLLYTSDAADDM
eukprot:1644717-Alexandrium_andersonii.AAC.1